MPWWIVFSIDWKMELKHVWYRIAWINICLYHNENVYNITTTRYLHNHGFNVNPIEAKLEVSVLCVCEIKTTYIFVNASTETPYGKVSHTISFSKQCLQYGPGFRRLVVNLQYQIPLGQLIAPRWSNRAKPCLLIKNHGPWYWWNFVRILVIQHDKNWLSNGNWYFIPNRHNVIHIQNNTTAMTIHIRACRRPPEKLDMFI